MEIKRRKGNLGLNRKNDIWKYLIGALMQPVCFLIRVAISRFTARGTVAMDEGVKDNSSGFAHVIANPAGSYEGRASMFLLFSFVTLIRIKNNSRTIIHTFGTMQKIICPSTFRQLGGQEV